MTDTQTINAPGAGTPGNSSLRSEIVPPVLQGRFAGIDLDALVDVPVVRTWLLWGMVWLMITPSVGAAISGLFNFPDYLGTGNLSLTVGRPRPIHVDGVICGACARLAGC